LACQNIAYSAVPAQIGAVTGARPKLRDDEFTGITYKDAAKSYLEKVGHAVSMEELLDALRDGGCPVGGKESKNLATQIQTNTTFIALCPRHPLGVVSLPFRYTKNLENAGHLHFRRL
jgi:hypothetical protein